MIEHEHGFIVSLKHTINQVLETDLPSVENIDFSAVQHLRKLLSVISEVAPFKPNILKLSQQVGVSGETLMKYLYLLNRADLLMLLHTKTSEISCMNKPEKVYLNNANLMYALTGSHVNTETLRETFFFNQLAAKHRINYSEKGDFLIDGKHTIEVGGKHKSRKQVSGVPDSYIAADNIEHAHGNKIPLWLFGFCINSFRP